jgi:hypothetical protein
LGKRRLCRVSACAIVPLPFAEELERQEAAAFEGFELASQEGPVIMDVERQRRQAIQRTLVAMGFLKIRRRRIPLPLKSIFRAKIS